MSYLCSLILGLALGLHLHNVCLYNIGTSNSEAYRFDYLVLEQSFVEEIYIDRRNEKEKFSITFFGLKADMSKRSQDRKAYYKQYAGANKEWRRRIILGGYYRRTFWPNLTSEEAYLAKEELCRKHNNRCDICKNESNCDSLRVDHDHSTGAIRGILCNKCNQGIGYFDECQDRLQQAILYLEYNKAQKLKG